MEKKLERIQHNKMVAGVASGLAEYLELDVTLVRVLFVLAFIFGLSGLLIYIVMWIAVPKRSVFQDFSAYEANYIIKEDSFTTKKQKDNSGRIIPGLVLIGIGIYFLLAEFKILPHWFSILKLWPVILIIGGITILVRSGIRRSKDTGLGIPNSSEAMLNSNTSPVTQPGEQPFS
jgi:phage shock protein PspC (stress-responsive transcriptional regulator)